MIKKYNNFGLLFGIPGLGLQVYGRSAHQPLFIIVGIIFLIVGLGYYAKSKGWNPIWGLLGLLSIIGVIILGLLDDKTKSD